MEPSNQDLSTTCLYELHREYGAKMVPFAGYSMPVQYPNGVLWEHRHTRSKAGLFDVSHMGQILLPGAAAAAALEKLVPADITSLKPGRQRYSFLTNTEGGVLDDIMVTNQGNGLLLVVNAGCKVDDLAWLQEQLDTTIEPLPDRALLALQGPMAIDALAALIPGVATMKFMDAVTFEWQGAPLWITRSGYTGEDGFEISIPDHHAGTFTRRLLEQEYVALIGLGARDSLRLEAGLCLYGHEIDAATSPIEAGLGWAIQTVRRTGGAREGGFPGAKRILAEMATGPGQVRCGIMPEGRGAMREGTLLFAGPEDDEPAGRVTSGCFGPSCERSIAMAYLPPTRATPGTGIWGEVRGRRIAAEVTPLPFFPHRYCR
jgi:aminomethyltransferase